MTDEVKKIKALANENKKARAKLEKAVERFFVKKVKESGSGVVNIKPTSVCDHEGTEIALIEHASLYAFSGRLFFFDDDINFPFYIGSMDDDSLVKLVKNCK